MDTEKIKKSIKKRLSEDFEKGLLILEDNLESNSDSEDELLLQKIKYHQLRKELVANLITREVYSVEFSKILFAVFSIVNNVGESSISKKSEGGEEKFSLNINKQGKIVNLLIENTSNKYKYSLEIGEEEKVTEIVYKILTNRGQSLIQDSNSYFYYPVLKKNNQILLSSFPIKNYDINDGDEICLFQLEVIKSPLDRRLLKEFIELSRFLKNTNKIFFEVIEWDKKSIPRKFMISYLIDSIIGVNEDYQPVIGNNHQLHIEIPNQFPNGELISRFKTDIWHPNVKYDGPMKGRVQMLNFDNSEFSQMMSTSMVLINTIMNIGKMLQYKIYHAKSIPPFPEDFKVAKWVTEFAEKKEIVNKDKSIYIDNSFLLG